MECFKKVKNVLPRIAVLLLLTAAGLILPAVRGKASEGCVLEQKYVLADARFRLYRVGTVTEEGFELTDAFARYPVYTKCTDAEHLREAAETLSALAVRDRIAPREEADTDGRGLISWSPVPDGVYLILGDAKTIGNVTYRPEPSLVLLGNGAEGKISITVKYERTVPVTRSGGNPGGGGRPPVERPQPPADTVPIPPDEVPGDDGRRIGEVVIRPRVRKVWYDEGFEENRPGSVRVSLLRNGEVREEAVLSEENDWEHVWGAISDTAGGWSVLEEVPEGYAFTVSRDGAEYIVCNYAGVVLPGTPAQLVPADGPQAGKLPQTGMIRWPAAVLAALGSLLILLGRRKKR